MDAAVSPTTRWLPVLAVLMIPGTMLAAEKNIPTQEPYANYDIPLWEDGKVPVAKGSDPLDKPFVTVFLPPEGKRNGGSVVVAPGGGNIMLMYGDEGLTIAER